MISINMLTCSASMYEATGLDEDRNPTYSDAINLSRVYLSGSIAQTDGTQGKQPNDGFTLYYDCYNSLPLGVTFKKGSKVVFNNEVYFINTITPVYKNGLDHYEIGLN